MPCINPPMSGRWIIGWIIGPPRGTPASPGWFGWAYSQSVLAREPGATVVGGGVTIGCLTTVVGGAVTTVVGGGCLGG